MRPCCRSKAIKAAVLILSIRLLFHSVFLIRELPRVEKTESERRPEKGPFILRAEPRSWKTKEAERERERERFPAEIPLIALLLLREDCAHPKPHATLPQIRNQGVRPWPQLRAQVNNVAATFICREEQNNSAIKFQKFAHSAYIL